jgi:hypothetical protein
MELSFEIFCLDITAEVQIDGKYSAATLFEPEEWPDLYIESLRCDGKDATFLLNSETLNELIRDKLWDAADAWAKERREDVCPY